MDFQSKSTGYLILKAIAMRQRDESPPGEGAYKHLSQMELSGISAQTVRSKTPKDHRVTAEDIEMENCLCKAKFTSTEGCVGTQA
jgi:hypothetical protein